MPKILTIDSAVFLSVWDESEALRLPSVHFFASLLTEDVNIVIPEIALFEIGNVLIRLGLRERLTEYMGLFSSSNQLDVVPLSAEIYTAFIGLSTRLTLKTADLIFCTVAHMRDSTLISWDKKLVKEAAKAVRAMTPSQYLSQHSH